MLGYVKPFKPELKIKEYECYKGYYCSLCKALGKNYGIFSRLFLSFDATFFLIFCFSVKNGNVTFKEGRCPFNPVKKCFYTDIDNNEFLLTSSLSVIIFFNKLNDGIRDSSLFKRILYYLAYPFVYFKYKKAKSIYPDIDEIINLSMQKQSELEKSNNSSVDLSCEPSACALGKCFALLTENENEKTKYYRFGYNLGRFVYLCDAFDDMKSDEKSNNYNVFVNNGYSDERIISVIRMSIGEAVNALEEIEIKSNYNIIDNTVRFGLDEQLCKIMERRGKDAGKSV